MPDLARPVDAEVNFRDRPRAAGIDIQEITLIPCTKWKLRVVIGYLPLYKSCANPRSESSTTDALVLRLGASDYAASLGAGRVKLTQAAFSEGTNLGAQGALEINQELNEGSEGAPNLVKEVMLALHAVGN